MMACKRRKARQVCKNGVQVRQAKQWIHAKNWWYVRHVKKGSQVRGEEMRVPKARKAGMHGRHVI